MTSNHDNGEDVDVGVGESRPEDGEEEEPGWRRDGQFLSLILLRDVKSSVIKGDESGSVMSQNPENLDGSRRCFSHPDKCAPKVTFIVE